jgi:glycosyltransferase involved in cell wall biosynthesis
MNVLFLTIGSKTTPSTRFRVKPYFPFLDAEKIFYRHLPIPHATHKRLVLLGHLGWADIVFLQKKLFSLVELNVLKRFKRPIIFDMDDVIFHEHPQNADSRRGRRKITRNRMRFEAIVQSARLVIAGNATLAEDVRTRGGCVSILPTPVDTDNYTPSNRSNNATDPIVVGWIGTASNLYYLNPIVGILARLSQRFPNVIVRLVCNKAIDMPGVRLENRRWSEENEICDLQGFHIGIMPLSDDIYSRGKCGFKLLQYMSVGLPTVSSPVGMNNTIVEHGRDGFLADTPLEWEARLTDLIRSAALRHSLGIAARQKVVEHYSVKTVFPSFLSILKAIHAGKSMPQQ